MLARVEVLPTLVADAEAKLSGSARALDDAGDKYRLTVTAFTEQAKADLVETYDRTTGRAAQNVAKTVEEQRAALQEAARYAFRTEAFDKAAALSLTLSEAAKAFRQSARSRMIEHATTALIASALTSGLVFAIVRGTH